VGRNSVRVAVVRRRVAPGGCAQCRRDRARTCGLRRDAERRCDLTGSAFAIVHRDLIIALAARHRLPAVYYERYFVTAGGLISYGADLIDQFRSAATYVDRILKGEKPTELPVQAATKYELVINLNTARALSIELPASVLARADEVIE
jgi:putative ABC transport system substrate-binding protein